MTAIRFLVLALAISSSATAAAMSLRPQNQADRRMKDAKPPPPPPPPPPPKEEGDKKEDDKKEDEKTDPPTFSPTTLAPTTLGPTLAPTCAPIVAFQADSDCNSFASCTNEQTSEGSWTLGNQQDLNQADLFNTGAGLPDVPDGYFWFACGGDCDGSITWTASAQCAGTIKVEWGLWCSNSGVGDPSSALRHFNSAGDTLQERTALYTEDVCASPSTGDGVREVTTFTGVQAGDMIVFDELGLSVTLIESITCLCDTSV